jgi:hypothetical protein
VGGVVMFAWFMISWMALPWHKADLMSFKDEKAVAAALTANAPESGTYVLPYTNMGQAAQKTGKPFAFVSVFAPGVNVKEQMPMTMGEDFGLCLFMAALLSCLLKKKTDGSCPVAFSAKAGLLAGAAAYAPMYIWYHFPLNFVLGGLADDVIAFALAGAAIACCVMKMKIGHCPMSACGTSKDASACATPDKKDADKK